MIPRGNLCRVLIALVVLPLVTNAQTLNLPSGGSWNSSASWNPSVIPNAAGAAVVFNGAATASNPAQTANRTITLDGGKTVGSIEFNNDLSTNTTTISTGTGGPLTFDETGTDPATINVPATVGTGNSTISAAMTLTDSIVVTVNNITASSGAGAMNLTGTISGPGGFTKQGDGLATFGTGAKTYNGATVISGGRMRISNAASPTATSGLTINGGQVTLISAGNYTFGSGLLKLNGNGSSTGPFASSPGAIRNDSGLIVTISNAVVLESDTLLHIQATAGTGSSATPTGSITFPKTISGPGRLTLTAPNSSVDQGTLALTASNSYSGGTLISGGIVSMSSAGTLGAGPVTVDNSASPSSIARLVIQAGTINAIADTATLSLKGGGAAAVADQNYIDLGAGVSETVGRLILNGVTQPPGTYGSSSSGAANQNDEYFTGSGVIIVEPTPTLKISANPPQFVFSWPTNSTGYGLESAASFASTNSWAGVNGSVVVSGTNYTVTVTNISGRGLYRLKK